MPNTINYAKVYVPLMDEVYKEASKSAVLESAAGLARAGANANEVSIPKIAMDGLADYDRNSGYTSGDVQLTWETVKYNYERGRMFTVDNMDNVETQNQAFGRLAGEFIRTQAAPELDAFRFSQYASAVGATTVQAALANGDQVIGAIREGVSLMDDLEVPQTERYLFITPTLKNYIDDLDTFKSRAAVAGFAQIITVPQNRFYTEIKLRDGKTAGEEAGGYTKAANGEDINFLIIHKPAIIQFTKHAVPKVISPDVNQDADAWKYGYRIYGISSYYENKTAGIYCCYR